MELRQVEYFLAVVENQGIGGAATALGVAQPTVSQALRALERELGVQLFHRIGRGMVPSAAGRTMVGPARQIIRDVDAVGDLLAAEEDELTGHLDLLASPATAVGPVVDLIARFRAAYPRVSVRLGELRDETRAASSIEDGHCEFAVAHLPIAGDALEVIVLGEQEYVLVYPEDAVVPDGPIPLGNLPAVPMVFVPRGHSVADELEEAIRVGGVRPPLAVLSEHREERLPMVLAGIGGTLLERSMAETAADRVVIRETEPRFVRPFAIAFDPASLSPVGQAFVELVRAQVDPPAE
ncbi:MULTISPECIES: LysR family transcriptional regulator [Gordonia]|uniref:LysR family transcriptional regulator n=1 Tax=Gordonia amicalis TaxID=89053 RepID=A0AAE4R2A2_9ACTN|nr:MULTISPECIES: LysR family transcriptional regulator [Gordonia]ATD70086.1 LysR family transcriptional regulator [Gordonia sp. 1D]MCZ4581664.1 LysR family transcriptional regulator [Gordonia amicalis]MDJ0455197.1 LysR family transcriptional regulator [Gordonia amicalis]MDV6306899.1 LysR family transcriptional regulator [Gordonia amicalis]MDV6311091.1 LysR family transcriptional regulator [Gordonia amicalis]